MQPTTSKTFEITSPQSFTSIGSSSVQRTLASHQIAPRHPHPVQNQQTSHNLLERTCNYWMKMTMFPTPPLDTPAETADHLKDLNPMLYTESETDFLWKGGGVMHIAHAVDSML